MKYGLDLSRIQSRMKHVLTTATFVSVFITSLNCSSNLASASMRMIDPRMENEPELRLDSTNRYGYVATV